ncbi:uncharacterized protein LOC106012567 [Aplysia californica]|uniref:Uncharacterized protein LOC106012567 n=1 Tax=Aplysia californica TaxID=6500 RepID=A0ABM1A5Q4_APLCA|nr:uncharacterized protein LOC106012567 [Aplysia californica]
MDLLQQQSFAMTEQGETRRDQRKDFRDTVATILRGQHELQSHLLELQRTNTHLLALIGGDNLFRRSFSPAADEVALPSMSLPFRGIRRHQNCSYFFRVHNIHTHNGADDLSQVYSQDWYLHHLGFRGSYGIGRTWDSVEIGLYLCFFGADGPESVRVRTSIKLVDPSNPNVESWIVGGRTGIIDSTSDSLYEWTRGYKVPLDRKSLRNRGFMKSDVLLVRFDVEIMNDPLVNEPPENNNYTQPSRSP